ncbi:MAG: hypothetical protein ASARMPRED_001731 [Alectoria sarmentosa]|nr:MAG: hypothetical protein ASARMPRED_001731 [Alectoria sarmentosa]
MEYHRVHAQSDPLINERRGALLHPDSPSANNGRLQAQANPPSEATNGAPKEAERHDASLSMNNGMLEAQPNSAHREAEERTADRHSKQGKSAFQNTLENFTPKWFAISMNTGILAILMHKLPYQFNGLHVLSIIMYLVDLTLFVIVCSMTILRWALYPETAKRKSAASIDEIAFLAAAPITFLYLTSLTGLIVSNAYWGGHAWSLVAYSMWWIGMAWMLTTCFVVNIALFRVNLVDDRSMTPSAFLPAVGVATAALVGGQVVNYSYNVSPRLAIPVIIVAYLLSGLAIWLSIILYGIFFHRLMASGWPEPAKRATLMLLVGPFGQTSAALQILAADALTNMDFAGYHKGTFLQASAASGVSSASILFALLLLGHDIFWIICCIFGILEGAFRRQLSYNLTWWGTIFPVVFFVRAGTMATAFLELSISMDSPTFKVLTTALLLLLLVDYFVNWAFTLYYIFTSDLLFKKADKDMPDEGKLD